MTDHELLEGVKEYIDRYMYEGSKYHLGSKDEWIKQMYNIIQFQQQELDEWRKEFMAI